MTFDSTPSIDTCESVAHDFLQCLIKNRNDRDACASIEEVIGKCNDQLRSMKGVPLTATYCTDEIVDYAKCSLHLNTSMCSSQYNMFHECKLRRKRFLFGEDLGLVKLNPQARKRW
jgi:hypothetical protein